MKRLIILLMLVPTLVYSQNDSVNNEQLNNYYKERGYIVPEPNTNMQIPISKPSTPIISEEEKNAYPLITEIKKSGGEVKQNDYQLSAYDKLQISNKSNDSVLGTIKDNRVNTIEYAYQDDVELTNKSLIQNEKKDSRSVYSYLLLGLLMSFVIFVVFRLKSKS